MINKFLNKAFQLTVKLEKSNANRLSEEYISTKGVESFLSKRLDENERARLAAFEGIIKSQISSDNKYNAALSRLEAAFNSGQIDSGNYFSQKDKIETMRKMENVQKHNEALGQEDDVKEDKLRFGASVGGDYEKSLYSAYKSERLKESGLLSGFWGKKKVDKTDKMMI